MLLLCAMDSQYQTELIYCQILQEEIGRHKATFTRFNPTAVRRQPLLDFLRTRQERWSVLVGSSELQTLRFPTYDRVRDEWCTFTKEQLIRFGQDSDENPC